MKSPTILASSAMVGLALMMTGAEVQAYSITYNLGNEALCATGTVNSQPAFEASMAGCGATAELYKSNVGGSDEGPFADSYNTQYFNTPGDPADATISWINGQPSISCSATLTCLLGIKDGNATPTYYIFDISDWDGTSSIVMTGFWPNGGAISNVSIWQGTGEENPDCPRTDPNWPSCEPPVVPEPGTLALLGLGLLGLGLSRKVL